MIIIIDGCDKSGKSTLSNFFCEAFHAEYYHANLSRGKNLYEKYVSIINQFEGIVVCDRFFTSEMVYGPVIRKSSRISDIEFEKLCTLVSSLGGIFIHCYASEEKILSRMKSQGEDFLKPSQVPKILSGFETITKTMIKFLPVFSYDTSLLCEGFKNGLVD